MAGWQNHFAIWRSHFETWQNHFATWRKGVLTGPTLSQYVGMVSPCCQASSQGVKTLPAGENSFCHVAKSFCNMEKSLRHAAQSLGNPENRAGDADLLANSQGARFRIPTFNFKVTWQAGCYPFQRQIGMDSLFQRLFVIHLNVHGNDLKLRPCRCPPITTCTRRFAATQRVSRWITRAAPWSWA